VEFLLKTTDDDIETATCENNTATSKYVTVVDTGNGLELYEDNTLKFTLDYITLSRLEVCVKMLDVSREGHGLLNYFKLYKAVEC